MDARGLLSLCEEVYYTADIVAGPKGRDGARVYCVEGCRILAFRGTLTEGEPAIADWLNDFHADFAADSRFPGCVHDGFLSSITALWPALLDLVQRQTIDKPLLITGHSKGGALAFLAAHLLAALNPCVVTFAAPKVGDADFAADYAVSSVWRYENPGDIVPKLPPWRYVAVGSQIVAPASFKHPEGVRANHTIETGYKPWVT